MGMEAQTPFLTGPSVDTLIFSPDSISIFFSIECHPFSFKSLPHNSPIVNLEKSGDFFFVLNN